MRCSVRRKTRHKVALIQDRKVLATIRPATEAGSI